VSFPDCLVLMERISEVLVLMERISEVLETDAEIIAMGRDDRVEALPLMTAVVEKFDLSLQATVHEQFQNLPSLVPLVISMWREASASGMRFTLTGEAPASRTEFHSRKRVRAVVDYEADGITVTLSHLDGHHAAWYLPQATEWNQPQEIREAALVS